MVHLCLVNCYSLDNEHKFSIPINGIHWLIRPNKLLQRCIIMNTHREGVQVPSSEVPSLTPNHSEFSLAKILFAFLSNILHYILLGTTFYANSLVQSLFFIFYFWVKHDFTYVVKIEQFRVFGCVILYLLICNEIKITTKLSREFTQIFYRSQTFY